MLQRETRYLLAAVQALIGWEWIVSGFNKILSGTFPQGLAGTLNDGIKGNPNGWYVSFIQTIVQPNSVFFGYLIEWTEFTVGLALLCGVVLLLMRPRLRGEPQYGVAVGMYTAVAVLAAAGAILCVNFHFWMGHSIIPGLNGSPTDEGIDLDALIPPFSLLITIANLYLVRELRGGFFGKRLSSPEKDSQSAVESATEQVQKEAVLQEA